MPPKRQVTQQPILASEGKTPKKKTGRQKAPIKPEKAPAWWVFTKASSTFVERAKVLAELLSTKYGEGISISHFERMLGELDSLPPQHAKLLDIEEAHLVAYQDFLEARKVRDAERESFRSSRDVNSIETGLAKANALFCASEGEAREEESEEQ
jgi:hypothetical protein